MKYCWCDWIYLPLPLWGTLRVWSFWLKTFCKYPDLLCTGSSSYQNIFLKHKIQRKYIVNKRAPKIHILLEVSYVERVKYVLTKSLINIWESTIFLIMGLQALKCYYWGQIKPACKRKASEKAFISVRLIAILEKALPKFNCGWEFRLTEFSSTFEFLLFNFHFKHYYKS